ncbi:MAG: hypothetical protein GX428_01540 [Candidatus Atribacteria bacterium]|nr:hypothetical protein [Candidatus Atribacteria bacterium]
MKTKKEKGVKTANDGCVMDPINLGTDQFIELVYIIVHRLYQLPIRSYST